MAPIVLDLETGEIREKMQEFLMGRFLEWHPDGQRFHFESDGNGPTMVNAETGEVINLIWERHIKGGSISPDGMIVAYINDGLDDEFNDQINRMVFVSPSGGDPVIQNDIGTAYRIFPGAWSPDSTLLIYEGSCNDTTGDQNVNKDICMYDTTTGVRRKLPIPSAGGQPILWSPDGRYLVTQGYRLDDMPCSITTNSGCIIYVMDIETGEVRPIIEGSFPTWSPDGKKLAYLSPIGGTTEVWVINLADGNTQQLTNDGKPKEYIFWTSEDVK
jgi:Tol biopolymer transport system component